MSVKLRGPITSISHNYRSTAQELWTRYGLAGFVPGARECRASLTIYADGHEVVLDVECIPIDPKKVVQMAQGVYDAHEDGKRPMLRVSVRMEE